MLRAGLKRVNSLVVVLSLGFLGLESGPISGKVACRAFPFFFFFEIMISSREVSTW